MQTPQRRGIFIAMTIVTIAGDARCKSGVHEKSVLLRQQCIFFKITISNPTILNRRWISTMGFVSLLVVFKRLAVILESIAETLC